MATLELPYDYRALARQLTARHRILQGVAPLHLHRKDTVLSDSVRRPETTSRTEALQRVSGAWLDIWVPPNRWQSRPFGSRATITTGC